MKVLRRVFLGTAMAVAAMSSHAQQTYTLNATTTSPFSCFNFYAPAPNCYGVPITSEDALIGKFWIDNTFISFLGDYEHLNGSKGLAEVTGVEVGTGSATYTFAGTDDSGHEYTGTLTWTFYTKRECGRGCYTIGEITGGKIVVTY